MSAVDVIDLSAILRKPLLLEKLHEIQRMRLQERVLTGGDRPRGMRLSIPDPVRRVKAAIDPFWAVSIADGLGERGYLMEDLLEVGLFHGMYEPHAGFAYVAQLPLQWHDAGVSAFDFVKDPTGMHRVVSCKSKDPKGRSIADCKPSSANVAQERRMLALAARPAGTEFEIWMVDPSTLAAAGPYVYELQQDDIDDAMVELRRVSAAWAYFSALEEPTEAPEWNDPEAWRSRFGLRSTSGAFKYATLDASAAIEKRVRAFVRARRAASAAEMELEQAKALIRPHVEEQVRLARLVDRDARRVTAHGADQVVTFTITANGQMRVDEKPAEKVEAA